jgi:hypothetical protein
LRGEDDGAGRRLRSATQPEVQLVEVCGAREILTKAGVEVIEIPYSEIQKNGGVLVQRHRRTQSSVTVASQLGIGSLRAIKSRPRSKPQTLWSVNRWEDCRALAAILNENRLRGRKLADYRIWRRALALRSDGARWKDRSLVDSLRTELRHSKRCQPDPPRTGDSTTPSWGYITGFIEGDGHFGIRGCQARLAVHLRADDLPHCGPIHLAYLDRTRPVLILTRELVRRHLATVTIALVRNAQIVCADVPPRDPARRARGVRRRVGRVR